MDKTKLFTITFNLNGEKKVKRTKDIEKAILQVQPEVIYTESFVTIQQGKERLDRHLNLTETKKLFRDSMFREIFINNLLIN